MISKVLGSRSSNSTRRAISLSTAARTLSGVAPRDPAGQLDQGHRALRRLDHLQDPIRQGVLQRPGDPAGPSKVAHITLEGQVEPLEVLDPGLAQHLEDDPHELVGEEDVIDVLRQFARLSVGGQEVQPSHRRTRAAKS